MDAAAANEETKDEPKIKQLILDLCSTPFILHEVKRASEASEASRSEMVEISRSLQLCMSFPSHIGKNKIFLPP